jgi:hypothetical protein
MPRNGGVIAAEADGETLDFRRVIHGELLAE